MLRIGTRFEDLARVYPWLDEEAAVQRLPKPMLHGMHVALEEAVMNVVMHAFPVGHNGEIGLTLRRCAGAAELVIEDDGRDFDPTKVVANTPPENLTEAEPGGMGLNLMRHYCADIRYERVRERNRLTLRFPLLQSSS